jgi:transcriptional regulator with XRE-family HTH domain
MRTIDDMTNRRENVRLALRRLDVRQRDVALACGVSQSLVSRVLRGEKSSRAVLCAVVALLDTKEAR